MMAAGMSVVVAAVMRNHGGIHVSHCVAAKWSEMAMEAAYRIESVMDAAEVIAAKKGARLWLGCWWADPRADVFAFAAGFMV